MGFCNFFCDMVRFQNNGNLKNMAFDHIYLLLRCVCFIASFRIYVSEVLPSVGRREISYLESVYFDVIFFVGIYT